MKTQFLMILASLIFTLLLTPVHAFAQTGESPAVPKFRILKVYDNAVALFMMARTNQMTFDSWEQFHDKTESSYRNIFYGSSSVTFESMITNQKMRVAAVYFRTYYSDLSKVTIPMIAKAYNKSSSPLAFAEKLEEMTEKTSMPCDSLQDEKMQARIQTAINYMIALRPLRAEQVQAEYQQYLEMVSSICK